MVVKQSDFLPTGTLVYPYLLMGEVTDTTAMIVNCLKDGEDIPLCVRRMDEVLQLKVVELSIHVINFLCSSSTLYLARGPDDEVEIKSVLEFSREFPKGG